MLIYKHIFFDLDNTLWDFSQSSHYALKKVFEQFGLSENFDSFEQFYQKYKEYNDILWRQYRKGEIDKQTLSVSRFLNLKDKNGHLFLSVKDATKMSVSYLAYMTEKPFLEPNAIKTLIYLKNKGYGLHIISDGFFEAQMVKLKISKIIDYISTVTISEEIGKLKPNAEIFEFALDKAGANKNEALFVGDDYSNDILGAHNFGIDQMLYNKKGYEKEDLDTKPTYTINNLVEITEIL